MNIQARSLALLALLSSAAAQTLSLRRAENVEIDPRQRALQVMTERDCYHECIRQGMTSSQCSAYIRSVLGENLKGSKYPDLEIKIARPRSATEKAATYWEIAIPTNLFGEVSCDIKGGIVSYRDPWVTAAGYKNIPDTDCFGLNAADCCEKIKTNVRNSGISLADIHGNCLSCWVHQQTLTPVIEKGGDLAYLVHAKDEAGQCSGVNLTPEEVQEVDTSVEAKMQGVSSDIDRVLQNGATCEELRSLQYDLMLHGRSFVRAMVDISRFLCGKCAHPYNNEYGAIPGDTREILLRIQQIIQGEVRSDYNRIIIYTDHGDRVMEPPKVGGSRAELDYDRDDPDCIEEEGTVNPDAGTPPGTDPEIPQPPPDAGTPPGTDSEIPQPPPDAGTPPGTDPEIPQPPPDAGTPPNMDRGGSEIPADIGNAPSVDPGTAPALAEPGNSPVADPATSPAAPTAGTPPATSPIGNGAPTTPTDSGVVPPPPPPKAGDTAPTSKHCTPTDLKISSATPNDPCFKCRRCLLFKCNEWGEGLYCRKVLKFKVEATVDQWTFCLKQNGGLLREHVPASDGSYEHWCACALKCEDHCLRNDVPPPPPEAMSDPAKELECTAKNIAVASGPNEPCEDCKKCIQETCPSTWAKERICQRLLQGTSRGSPLQWAACLKSDGMKSMLDDGFYDKGDGAQEEWGACAERCHDRCNKVEPQRVIHTGEYCSMEDLSTSSMKKGEACQDCRACMRKRCFYWKQKCQAMLFGIVAGTAEEWTRCMTTCGRGLRGDNRDLQLSTVNSKCDCYHPCSERCRKPAAAAAAAAAAPEQEILEDDYDDDGILTAAIMPPDSQAPEDQSTGVEVMEPNSS